MLYCSFSQEAEIRAFDSSSSLYPSSDSREGFGGPEGVFHAVAECSVVLGGPLDPSNHFDRALTAGAVSRLQDFEYIDNPIQVCWRMMSQLLHL